MLSEKCEKESVTINDLTAKIKLWGNVELFFPTNLNHLKDIFLVYWTYFIMFSYWSSCCRYRKFFGVVQNIQILLEKVKWNDMFIFIGKMKNWKLNIPGKITYQFLLIKYFELHSLFFQKLHTEWSVWM